MASDKASHRKPDGIRQSENSMIHCTTYTSPSGSILGALIEAREGDKVQFAHSLSMGEAKNIIPAVEFVKERLEVSGVCYRTETVSLRKWFGIS